MKRFTGLTRRLAAAALMLAGLAGTGAAHASWLGLNDGTYKITLLGCDLQPNCTNDTGTITVAGSGLSFMSFLMEGVLFEGDPNDYVQNATAERSDIQYFSATVPLTFFSLVNSVQPGLPNLYVYCRNVDAISCRPDTLGSWTAAPVPEPGSLALATLALLGVIAGRATWRRAGAALA